MKGMIPNRLILILVLGTVGLYSKSAHSADDARSWDCLNQQVVELTKEPLLLAAINNYNSNPPDPMELDKVWPSLKDSSDIIYNLVNNKAADKMREWILDISIQGEGLLIGNNGGLVAATEKTTDFWQGDEAQFLQAIKLPESDVHIQKEILDESTNLMLLKISAPIYNPKSRHPVGVLVLGFDQFVIDFNQPCKDT